MHKEQLYTTHNDSYQRGKCSNFHKIVHRFSMIVDTAANDLLVGNLFLLGKFMRLSMSKYLTDRHFEIGTRIKFIAHVSKHFF